MENVSVDWEANQQANICSQGKIRITLYNSSGTAIDTLEAEDLLSYTATERATAYTTELPRNEYRLTFTTINNAHYNFVNNSIGKKTKVEYGFVINNSVEYCDGGVFYIQTCKRQKANHTAYDVSAIDILSAATELYKWDSFPTAPPDAERDLSTVANAIGASLGWSSSMYDFSSLSGDKIRQVVPVVPYNVALQLIANAAHKALFVNRQGQVWIDSPSIDTYTMPRTVVFPYPRREEEPYKKNIHVKVYTPTMGSTIEVATYVFNTGGSTETIEVDYPTCAIPSVYVKSGTGDFHLLQKTATHAVFSLNCSSNVTIGVQGMLMEYHNYDYNYQLYQYGDEDWYVDNALITNETLAMRQTSIPQPGIKCELECRLNPALNVLDLVSFDSGGAYAMYFRIEEMTIIFNGGFKGILRGTM